MYLLWLRVAAILFAAASIAAFPAAIHGSTRWRQWCVHLAGVGLFFHVVSAVEMLALAHRWTPAGAREVESLLGLALAVFFFLLLWIYDAFALGLFALPATFFLLLAPALGARGYTFPSAGVRTGWLIAHIVALLLAYAALLFSILASLFYLLQESRLKSKRCVAAEGVAWLPPLETLERIAFATLQFGFPCMTVGLVVGAVLVQETPLGAAYFRDPKVIASFVSWAIYVLLLLVRRSAGWRGRKAAFLSGSVLMVMILVWAANLLSHVHRFGAQ